MNEWTKTTVRKELRKVGGVWIDPLSVEAVSVSPYGEARFHLRGGGVVDSPIPEKGIDWMIREQLFKKVDE